MQNQAQPHCIIIMGVSGSGKTVIGKKIAASLNYPFIEGDDLHPETNVDKMRQGIPLTDEDRMPWLDRIVEAAKERLQADQHCVVACSALKKAYRNRLREIGNVIFLYIHGDFGLMLDRMTRRKGHFMPQSLLKSQFDTLEEPDSSETDALTIDNSGSPEDTIEKALDALQPFTRS
ncbi:MAG: AAA family ATPase [Mucilaginibacter polytrichastri]|nr:AAA family ATPase [Mucilaginibacter polytrichastri]